MSDIGEGQVPPEEVKPKEEAPQGDKVVMSKDEYAGLVKKMSQLEDYATRANEYFKSLEEQKPPEAHKGDEVDPYVDMTPKQFAEMLQSTIMNQVIEKVGNPLMQAVVFMGVKAELKELRKQYDDFDNYKDDIQAIAMKNPSLSLEDAYLQAKAKKVGFNPPKPPKPDFGEKPGGPMKATMREGAKPLSVRDAALKAMENLKFEEPG